MREEGRKLFIKVIFSFLFIVTFFFTVPSSAYAVNPDEISDLMLWLDASQGVTTDGTTPAVDDDLIQQWDDLSISTANATQTTPANKPTYKTNILNGNPVIRFSGAQSMVTSSFLDSTFDTDFTFFIVANKSDNSFCLSTSNQGSKWYSARASDSVIYNVTGLSVPASRRFYLFSPKDDQDYGIDSFRYDGSVETLRFDDITAGTTDTRTRNASGNLGLSGALTIGDYSSGGFNYNGDIAEIIIYNRALTDVELVQVAQYLSTKYDISARTVPDMPASGLSLPQIVFDGDSMVAGYSSTDDLTYPNQTITLLGGTENYSYINLALGGQTVAQMTTDVVSEVDSLLQYGSSRPYNILVLMGGTNDLGQPTVVDATTTYNRIVAYAQGRKSAGFEVIVTTILPRSTVGVPVDFETSRQTVNSLIRANWETFADGISDVALDSSIGDEGDELDTTYYADKVHMTNTGYGIVASYATAAINQIIDPIAVSDISVTPSTTTADISWATNQTGSTQVNYGLTDSYGSSTAEADTDTRVLSHSDNLSNLVANTTYHFQTASNDLNSNQVLSTDQSFTTLADTPTNIVSTSQSAVQIGVSVDTFPNYSTGSAGYYFENVTAGSNSGWIQTNSWQNAGLSCNYTYSYSVKYRNGDGTETTSISTAVSTSGCESGLLPYLYNSSSTRTVDSDTVDSDSDSVSQEINLRAAPVFEDISDHWAEEFIEDLYMKGVVSGYDESHFGPENNILRAELTKIAIEAFGISLSDEGGGRFPDVPENEWYAPYVQTAYLENIVGGYADGTFGPNKNVTRAEALRILFDAAGIDVETDYDAGFSDVPADAWYASYVNYAAENGIVSGYSDGTFGPNEKLTRAQISKIVSLMIGVYID